MKKAFERLEAWFLDLPEYIAVPLLVAFLGWVILFSAQFCIGLGDAPKKKSMCYIEIVFPGYQMGLLAGTRINGEERYDR